MGGKITVFEANLLIFHFQRGLKIRRGRFRTICNVFKQHAEIF